MESLFRRPEKTMVFLYRQTAEQGVEYLLLQRAQSRAGHIWQTVVGTAEWGEELVEAARREVYEETGLTRLGGLMAAGYAFTFTFKPKEYSRYRPDLEPVDIHNVVFAAKILGEQQVRLSDEHVDHGWFSYQEALNMMFWPEDREALTRLDPMLRRD